MTAPRAPSSGKPLDLRARIGVDCGRQLAIEDAVVWAAQHGVSYLEVEADHAPNALESFTAERCDPLRAICANHGIHLGLHTLSAVNVGETSPFVRDAVDLDVDVAHAVARRPGDSVLEPDLAAEVDADAVLEVHRWLRVRRERAAAAPAAAAAAARGGSPR